LTCRALEIREGIMRTRPDFVSAYSTRFNVLALLAILALPATVTGQQALSPVQIEARRASRAHERADLLEARAEQLRASPRWYLDAARLYRRAALLRGNDARAVNNFRSSAWMYSAAGNNGLAREMMEKAAEHAADVGGIEDAANAYIDAAFLAVASDRQDKVPALLGRMHAVLSSPLLPETRRASILQRIGENSEVARLDSVVVGRSP
jgi:hypothetical protein